MDPFEVRMQFVTHLSRLTSSLANLQKLIVFLLKHTPKYSVDLFDCLLEECHSQPSLNIRINMLFLLDWLLEKEQAAAGRVWKELVQTSGKLRTFVVDGVVGDKREGRINLMSVQHVIKSWKLRRLINVDLLDQVLEELERKKHTLPTDETDTTTSFSRNDILRRIEDDRERHKRLRERIWVLPIPNTLFTTLTTTSSASNSNTTLTPSMMNQVPSGSGSSSIKPSPISPVSPASDSLPINNNNVKVGQSSTSISGGGVKNIRGPEYAIELEFEQSWARMNDEFKIDQDAQIERYQSHEPDQEEHVEEKENEDEDEDGDERPKKKVKLQDQRKGWELSPLDRFLIKVENSRCFK